RLGFEGPRSTEDPSASVKDRCCAFAEWPRRSKEPESRRDLARLRHGSVGSPRWGSHGPVGGSSQSFRRGCWGDLIDGGGSTCAAPGPGANGAGGRVGRRTGL